MATTNQNSRIQQQAKALLNAASGDARRALEDAQVVGAEARTKTEIAFWAAVAATIAASR